MNQVFVLCTGEKTIPRSQFLYRDPSSSNLLMAFYFWVVLSNDGPIIVDCSFGAEEARRRNVENYRERRELLATCGVAPEDVKIVFITHLHYDHWATQPPVLRSAAEPEPPRLRYSPTPQAASCRDE